jgi:hypothetical protein
VQNIDIRMELEKLFCLIHFDKHRRGEGKSKNNLGVISSYDAAAKSKNE